MNLTTFDPVVITKWIGAPIGEVWKAWTDPGAVLKWYGSDPNGWGVSSSLDVRAGGAYEISFSNSDGSEHTCRGVFLEVREPEELIFNWEWKSEPGVVSIGAGRLDLPKIEVPEMTGAITDFNTFFVAIAPQTGSAQLRKKADRFTKKEPARGDFSNGKTILKGDDCLAVSMEMTDETAEEVLLRTSFIPPAENCLAYLSADMATPVVKDTLNNFQMVRPAGPDKYNVLFGREWFTIDSRVRRSDGKLESAVMVNELSLKIRVNCNSGYSGWQAELPFRIQRKLQLELLTK